MPKVIVADEVIEFAARALITPRHSSTVHLFPQSSLRISGTNKSAAPGTESAPADLSRDTAAGISVLERLANQTISDGENTCSQSLGHSDFILRNRFSAHSRVNSGLSPPCNIICFAPRSTASVQRDIISSSGNLKGFIFPAPAW